MKLFEDHDAIAMLQEREAALPTMYITYGFWIMVHLQSVPIALAYAVLGELAEALFLTVCHPCRDWLWEPDSLARILLVDVLNRAVGIVVLGKTARVLFRVPPIVPSFWNADKSRITSWYLFAKYAVQVWSVRAAGLVVAHRQTVFGAEDYPLGHVAFMLVVIALPLLYYEWNRAEQPPFLPRRLYLRTYAMASCTMGLLNAACVLEFAAAYAQGLAVSLFLLTVFVFVHLIFVVPEDRRLAASVRLNTPS